MIQMKDWEISRTPPVSRPGHKIKKKIRERFNFPLTGLPLSRLWPLARRLCAANFDEGEGFEEEEKPPSSGLKMCTCELSLSYADSDMNRGLLNERRSGQTGIDSAFNLGLLSVKWPRLHQAARVQL